MTAQELIDKLSHMVSKLEEIGVRDAGSLVVLRKDSNSDDEAIEGIEIESATDVKTGGKTIVLVIS